MSLQIFVIFHEKIYPDMYSELEPDEFECFKFVAVNGATSEFYKDHTINEWELEVYDPSWQKNKWMNGGVNHHIVLNKLITAEYAGFVQYDMKFKKGSIRHIKSLLKPSIGVSIRTMNFENLIGTSTYGFSEYNMYDWALEILGTPLKSQNFPLYHMCIMKSSFWYDIMPKVLEIDRGLFEQMRSCDPWYRFAITTERTLALAIGCALDDVIDVSEYLTHERLAGQNNKL
jgi:hypothetical protein